jgi:hypothetical protein
MNRKIHLLLSAFFITAIVFCSSAQKDSTIYVGVGSEYVFFSDSTYKLIFKPCDICPNFADENNIISYGRFVSYGDTALILTSDPILNVSDMTMRVDESTANRKDIKIAINVPASKDSSDMLANHYFYAIEIAFLKYAHNPAKDSTQKACDLFYREFYNNEPVFVVTHDSMSLPVSIKVKIYPKEPSRESFAQGLYHINKTTSNTFIIHIPQFVTGFLNYERMDNFVLERLGIGFIGDGVRTYVREDIYKEKNYSPWNLPECLNWRYCIPHYDLFQK